jgi:chromosome segregation ATPase
MSWFKKDKKKEEISSLPELPEIPEVPNLDIPRLPSFPTNSLGERFSQNSIKEAVGGGKEDIGEEVDEFEEERMMPEPPKPFLQKRIFREEIPKEVIEAERRVREAEPLFVKIEKFKECNKILENIKEKVNQIEKMLNNTKELKEKEEKELQDWENKIKATKQQIEKIDIEIFSKAE